MFILQIYLCNKKYVVNVIADAVTVAGVLLLLLQLMLQVFVIHFAVAFSPCVVVLVLKSLSILK